MNKQEEIDRGLREILHKLVGDESDYWFSVMSKDILTYLHSKGVVIQCCEDVEPFKDAEWACHSTVEPLI